ncbi:MAG TPA: hypothetical protein QF753_13430 [Victivallales bacterium]|nr:hypothetical protein [Victivallales bacterium]
MDNVKSSVDYKQVDRSDPVGVTYFFIRLFSYIPTCIFREILMFSCIRKTFFKILVKLFEISMEKRVDFPKKIQLDKYE